MRRGFTLIETVVALASACVLMLALGSTLLIASRAVPTGEEVFVTQGRNERGLVLLAAEVEEATDLYTDSTAIYLTVPDRDGDGTGEFIIYDWTTADRMMTRTHNNGTAEALFGPVDSVTVKPAAVDGRLETVSMAIVLADAVPASRTVRVRLFNRPEAR